MDTYLVTFSINLNDKLKEVYDEIVKFLTNDVLDTFWRKKGDSIKITKTTFIVCSDYSRDYIRNKIEAIFKKFHTGGTILVVEIKLSGWSFHGNEELVKWMRKNISCIDNEEE